MNAIEDRLRTLAADVRVDVRGDATARVEARARARQLRTRAGVATAAVAGVATAAGVVAAAPPPATRDGARLATAPPAPPTTAATTPAAAPAAPVAVLPAAKAAAVLATCDEYLRAMTGQRESFPPDAVVAAWASDGIGDTALIADDLTYRACHLLDGVADDVDPVTSERRCDGEHVAFGELGWGPTGVANRLSGKEPGSGTGPKRFYWLMYGCVSPRVARVVILPPRGQAFEAEVVNGLFVGRRDTGYAFDPAVDDPGDEPAVLSEQARMRAYDAAGTLVARWPRTAAHPESGESPGP